jgi:hypothetical protein
MDYTIVGSMSLLPKLLTFVEADELYKIWKVLDNAPRGDHLFAFYAGTQEIKHSILGRTLIHFRDKENWRDLLIEELNVELYEAELSEWDPRRKGAFYTVDFRRQGPFGVGMNDDFISTIRIILTEILNICIGQIRHLEYSWYIDKIMVSRPSEVPLLSIIYHIDDFTQSKGVNFYFVNGQQIGITCQKCIPGST